MDPVSHALIGLAVSTVGQGKMDISSPVTAAYVLGSITPDADIILRLWGNSLYLKHHRGVSHSLVGVAVESAALALALKLIYIQVPVFSLFIWSAFGMLTHIIADILNSYGAKIFWPFSNRKNSLSLLTITDPIVVLMSILLVVFSFGMQKYDTYIYLGFTFYVLSKIAMHALGRVKLRKRFGNDYNIEKIQLLPSMMAGHKFHYIVEDSTHMIVGEINFLSGRIEIINVLKRLDEKTRKLILNSRAAAFFKEFTPIFHIELQSIRNGYKALLTDLRYMLHKKFLHHVTIVYDKNMTVLEEKFHPYNMNNHLDF